MQTKTIKLNKGEYTDLLDEFENHDIILLNGARGSGKSYPTAKYISRLLIKDPDAKFIYMRILTNELSTAISWCDDLLLSQISGCDINEVTRG